ncbi:MAG TPA: copper ion binding protein [Tepidiformaceae bacterium]
MATTLELSITGMTCDHCVHAVTTAVQDVEGVKTAKVSLEEKSAVVEGDALDAAKIIAAIEEEGYGATVR